MTTQTNVEICLLGDIFRHVIVKPNPKSSTDTKEEPYKSYIAYSGVPLLRHMLVEAIKDVELIEKKDIKSDDKIGDYYNANEYVLIEKIRELETADSTGKCNTDSSVRGGNCVMLWLCLTAKLKRVEMAYAQLTLEERYQISALKKAGHSQTRIAEEMGCHKSTVGRELRRNAGARGGYFPKQRGKVR